MKRLEVINKEKIQFQIQEYFNHHTESRFLHRLHGILLFISREEESCDSTGALFGNSPRTVSNWIRRINETGDLESLREKARSGRRSKLSLKQKEELKEILQRPPEKSGIATNIWDGKSLSYYIKKEYNVELKVRACQKLFHELGLSLKRARPVVSKTDPAKKEISKKTPRERAER
jgi:transposase